MTQWEKTPQQACDSEYRNDFCVLRILWQNRGKCFGWFWSLMALKKRVYVIRSTMHGVLDQTQVCLTTMYISSCCTWTLFTIHARLTFRRRSLVVCVHTQGWCKDMRNQLLLGQHETTRPSEQATQLILQFQLVDDEVANWNTCCGVSTGLCGSCRFYSSALCLALWNALCVWGSFSSSPIGLTQGCM